MYQNDVMPTDEWFKKIKPHVNFKGKSVIDYGCAEGIMCMLAKDLGATRVIGIDHELEPIVYKDVEFLRESIGKKYKADIKIFSMIIHWIGKAELLRQADSETLVIIFREANDGYENFVNGVWFPTLKELSLTLKGYTRKHSEVLMEQDNGKRIILAIYESNKA